MNKKKIKIKKIEKRLFTHKNEKSFGPGFAGRRPGKAGVKRHHHLHHRNRLRFLQWSHC